MRIPTIYLETTMFNYYFEKGREAYPYTVRLFDEIRKGLFEPYTSQYVIDELALVPEPKRTAMLGLIDEFDVRIFDADLEAERLADLYVTEGIIPPKYKTDGRHIAIATVKNLHFIVSLNFKHIVRRRTVLLTEVVNVREGYGKVGIFSPMEVVGDERAE